MIFYLKNHNGDNAEMMRICRNQLLSESDWTQLADAQCDKEAWAVYRQALRDFPDTWEQSESADFPARPDEPEVEETTVEVESVEGEQP
jgi:hypothetical protein